jgi:hypothetical protein
VIVDDLDIRRVPVSPTETNAPLVVDSDAVAAGAVAAEPFQAIARRDAKVIERSRVVQHSELPPRDLL